MKSLPAELAAADQRRLRILGELGRGGFGVVLRAEVLGEGGFRKDVAIKVLHRGDDDQEIVRRLRDEARILGLIRHPGVVQVDSLLQLDGRWAVVMEYIDGADLGRVLRDGPLPPRVALEITSEVARVLGAAWSALGPEGLLLRVVHRDIKPPNIRLTPQGTVKVLDFGVARAEFGSREADTRSASFGTLPYMSPERLEWVDGPEGDIYALGAVLFEMLTGEGLGRTSAQRERHEAHVQAARRRLSARLPLPDPGVEELLLSMLAYDPSARPPPGELEDRCDGLADALGGERLKRWVGRVLPGLKEPSARHAPATEHVSVLVQLTEDTFRTLDAPRAPVSTSAPVAAEMPPRQARSRLRRVAVGAGAVLVAGAIGAMAAIQAVGHQEIPVGEPPPRVAEETVPGSEPPPEPAPTPAPAQPDLSVAARDRGGHARGLERAVAGGDDPNARLDRAPGRPGGGGARPSRARARADDQRPCVLRAGYRARAGQRGGRGGDRDPATTLRWPGPARWSGPP